MTRSGVMKTIVVVAGIAVILIAIGMIAGKKPTVTVPVDG